MRHFPVGAGRHPVTAALAAISLPKGAPNPADHLGRFQRGGPVPALVGRPKVIEGGDVTAQQGRDAAMAAGDF